ncbi:MAG: cytochrome c [Candidatus Sericytochromatia bacterium]|nr:cytochrome c [Candidatus Sericytochromatia bacterium]
MSTEDGPGTDPDPLDRQSDVTDLHASLRREGEEPAEGHEPAPWWLWAGAVLAIFVGGFYFGRHSGTFTAAPHQGFIPHAGPGPSASATQAPPDGSKIYAGRCASCHQPDAKGVPGAFPPLIGSGYVTGPPETPIRILLHGLQGQITVGGQTYNGIMPAWKDQLSDAEIAAVISYERSLPGNGAPAIAPEAVAAVRRKTATRTSPWTAGGLKAAAGGP